MDIFAQWADMVVSSLWRTCMVALFLALVGNILLYRLSADEDWFANVIAIGSGLAAAGLIIARFYPRVIEAALGLSFVIWVANAIEFATESFPFWDNKVRQCGFYAAFAIISLGCWLSVRERQRG